MRVVLSKSPKVQIHRFIHATLVTFYKPVPTVQNVSFQILIVKNVSMKFASSVDHDFT